jgi:hypothetical protein
MRFIDASGFTSDRPWGALDLLAVENGHRAPALDDTPYVWHVNDGPEVFVVLDGAVDMHYRNDGVEHVQHLVPGVVCVVEPVTSTWPTRHQKLASSSWSVRAASEVTGRTCGGLRVVSMALSGQAICWVGVPVDDSPNGTGAGQRLRWVPASPAMAPRSSGRTHGAGPFLLVEEGRMVLGPRTRRCRLPSVHGVGAVSTKD